MQFFWAHGPATVRELQARLADGAPPAYTTVMSICNRLHEKGLLERQRVTPGEVASRAKQAYVYRARLSERELASECEFVSEVVHSAPEEESPPVAAIQHQLQNGSAREAIESLLGYLETLCDSDGYAIELQALHTITALLERAESAERAITMYQAEALRALHRAAAAERRAILAETSPASTELHPDRTKPVPSSAVYEYPGEQKICRVCGRPAPPPYGQRRNALRVCAQESCRREARRRDNVAKQHRSNARKRAQLAVGVTDE
jgi:predicted transcriptional regulator